MADEQGQDPIIANVEGVGQLSFPAGTDPSVVDTVVKQALRKQKDAAEGYSSYGPARLFVEASDRPVITRKELAESGPVIGGGIGAMVGGVPGAIVGGMYGALGRDLERAGRTDPNTPKTGLSAAGSVANEGFKQGAQQAAWELGGEHLIPVLGNFVKNRAVPLVQSALKAPWEFIKRRAAIEGITEPEALKDISQHIVDYQLEQPEQAKELGKRLGQVVTRQTSQREFTAPDVRVDTAERIPEALTGLGRQIEERTDPGAARTALQNYGRRLVEDSPLSRSTYVAPPSETLEEGLARGIEEARAIEARRAIPAHEAQRPRLRNPNLKELQSQTPPRTGVVRDVPETSTIATWPRAGTRGAEEGAELAALLKRADEATPGRVASQAPVPPVEPQQFTGPGGAHPQSSRPRELNPDMKPSELLRIIRAKSVFEPTTSVAEKEAARVAERASRDSFKAAVPNAAPVLEKQGLSKDAQTLLRREVWREANRDVMPGGLGQVVALAQGRPIIGALMQAAKAGQLKAGLAAGRYGPRIARSGATVGTSGPQIQRLLQLLLSAAQPEE